MSGSTGGDAPGCPLCGGHSRRRFERHGFWIRDCEACAHRFAEGAAADGHVERVYDDAYFRDGGAGYAGYLDEERLLRDRGRWYARLLARHVPPGSVLDVGCAAGFWLASLVESGWTGRGVEPNAAMAEHARARLGLDVRTGTLETLHDPGEYDLVAMIQVLAHFVDPRRALEVAVARTRGPRWASSSGSSRSRGAGRASASAPATPRRCCSTSSAETRRGGSSPARSVSCPTGWPCPTSRTICSGCCCASGADLGAAGSRTAGACPDQGRRRVNRPSL
jgi:SAM-dependent methyltransferase